MLENILFLVLGVGLLNAAAALNDLQKKLTQLENKFYYCQQCAKSCNK